VATLYAVFLGFYLSYAVMQLGLAHDWFKVAQDQVATTVAVFLICWLVVIVMLTAATLKLPIAFTVLLGLVDVALAILLINLFWASFALQMLASAFVFGFVALGIYLYFHVMSLAFGGKGLPLGRPLA